MRTLSCMHKRPACSWILFLVLLLTGPTGTVSSEEDQGPTRADVLAALRDEQHQKGKDGSERFRAWGDRAVPHLREIAHTREASSLAFAIARVTKEIDSDAAADLFVELLEGQTAVPRILAISGLSVSRVLETDTPFMRRLVAHPRFKPAIVGFAGTVFRSYFIDLAARLEWKDMVPRLRELLQDPEFGVRQAAAGAITALTGEAVEIAAPQTVLPGEALVPGLVGEPTVFPRLGVQKVDLMAFVRWFDGTPRFCYGWSKDDSVFGHKRQFRIMKDSLGTFSPYALPEGVVALRMASLSGGARLIANSEDRETGIIAHMALCLEESGKQLWRYRPPDQGLKDHAILYDDKGAYGTVLGVGGVDGLIAVDFDGKQLWQVPRLFVTYEVSSHPALPDYCLQVGGDYKLYEHTRKTAVLRGSSKRMRPPRYVHNGVIFPDAAGKPAIVCGGTRLKDDVPMLWRFDARGQVMWEATFAADIEALHLLEPEGRKRLLVLTTKAGMLYVIGDDGVLHWRCPTPLVGCEVRDANAPRRRVATYALHAGAYGKGRYAIALSLLGDVYWLTLDTKLLPGPGEK